MLLKRFRQIRPGVGRHNSVTETLHNGWHGIGMSRPGGGKRECEQGVNECGKALTKLEEIDTSDKRGNYRESA